MENGCLRNGRLTPAYMQMSFVLCISGHRIECINVVLVPTNETETCPSAVEKKGAINVQRYQLKST